MYRDVVFDFSNKHSHYILRRLSKMTKAPTFVRKLKLKNCNEATDEDWCIFLESVPQFTGLRDFSWDHYGNLSVDILESFTSSQLRLHVELNQMFKRNTDAQLLEKNLLNCQLTVRLTTLRLVISEKNLYVNLKRDLIAFLQRSPSLETLDLHQLTFVEGFRRFNDMVPEFEKNSLPRLRSLTLGTVETIFSAAELHAWGSHDGWSYLNYLKVRLATNLIPFVSKAPRLERLKFIAHNGHGLDELEAFLKMRQGHVFASLRQLTYSHFIRDLNGPLQHVLPWCVLERVGSGLICFYLVNDQRFSGQRGAVAPNSMDLERLHTLCPNLQHLNLDLNLEPARWPGHIVKALARWENVTKMELVIQKPPAPRGFDLRNADSKKLPHTEAVQLLAYEDICRGRDDLIVTIIQWRNGVHETDKPHRLTHIFCKDEHGRTKHTNKCASQQPKVQVQPPREDLTMLSDEALKSLQRQACTKRLLATRSNDREASKESFQSVTAAIKLRERKAELEKIYGDDSMTLYEYEMSTPQSQHQEVSKSRTTWLRSLFW
jgi:hypothetical protein